ncbi:hypothetical protein FOI68_20695 [Brevibacillus sp. LEMMJ03]|uniref:hypothetical protein n=1 Tax=Brevibacillus sp. LEMMJ03 TaxID=2595056 RepID=UPI00117D9DE1|nr:hypothetical protein [Brevibacillus sp. LEMMJ03]TRY23685.1 hypothetical protein FOI68_20695 [Brevibacillus sp. LEMMJ03]
MIYRPMVGGDYTMGLPFLSGADAVKQAINTRLKLLMNEWWEQMDDGLPLFQHILGVKGHPDSLRAVDLLVQERIMGTPHVSRIVDFQSSYDGRAYSCQCSVETTFGETIPITTTF